MFRLLRRLTLLLVVALVLYEGVTFVQVLAASRRDGAEQADAIVVLGAAQYNGRPSAVLRARLDHAADLYDRGLADTIVVTGGQQADDPTRHTEASASADYLAAEHGISQDVILRENDGRNTWESLAFVAPYLKRQGKVEVILVSDGFHNARIAAISDELGLDAHVSPTPSSPIGGTTEFKHLAKETVLVSVGRVIGFRQLMGIERVRQRVENR